VTHHADAAKPSTTGPERDLAMAATVSAAPDARALTPSTVAWLQRTAGNVAVGRLLGHTLQRDGTEPATLEEAIKTGDSDALKPFRPFKSVSSRQLLEICNIVLTNAWVGPDDESTLEEAWKACPRSSLGVSDLAMWKRCVDRGADSANVPWMKELQGTFADETRRLASDNLEKNATHIRDEAGRLGVGTDGKSPGPTPGQDKALAEQEKLAKRVKDFKDAMAKLRDVPVGYAEGEVPEPEPEANDKTPPAGAPGPQEVLRRQFNFRPGEKPPFPPTGKELKKMATHELLQGVWDDLNKALARILNQNPALYALELVGDIGKATPDKAPPDARAEIGKAFDEILGNIAKTKERIAGNDLGFQHLIPVHDKLYAAKFTSPFDGGFLKEYVKAEDGSEETMKAVIGVAAIALIMTVEIGSAGAATPLLVPALIGAAGSGATAAASWEAWAHADTAAKSTVTDDLAVMNKQQADDALDTAVLDSAMALIDVYQVAKAVHGAESAARVAGLVAANEGAEKLTKLAAMPAAERIATVTASIESEGVATVVSRSGKSAEELLAMVGKESPAGQRLTTFIETTAKGGGAKAAEELGPKLAKISTLGFHEADDVAMQAIDLLGPGSALQRASGWAALEKSVGQEAASMKRLRAWRTQVMDGLETFMEQRRATQAVAGSVEEDLAAARGFVSQRAGIAADEVEHLLGTGLAEVGTMERTARVAVGIKHFFTQPADARTRLNALIGIVNPILEEKGVPAAMAIFEKNGYMAFDKGPWNVDVLNALLTKPQLTEAEFKDVVDCVYHEARHAEQFWMMARMKAGEGMGAGEIVKTLKVPQEVAESAVAKALPRGSAEAEAAAKWHESIFGAGRAHRQTVYAEMDKAEKTLKDVTKHLEELMDAGAPRKLQDLALHEVQAADEAFRGWDEAYRMLPEEVDAYAVQGKFRKVLDETRTEAEEAIARAEAARLAALDDAMPDTVKDIKKTP